MMQVDVLVAGGGLAGVAAAVSAAREGSRVLLVEQTGCLGGMATSGLVNPFMPHCVRDEHDRWRYGDGIVNAGLYGSLLETLYAEGAAKAAATVTFNEEVVKRVLDTWMTRWDIRVLFHSTVSAARMENRRVHAVTVAGKYGFMDIEAAVFIDATGDADLSAHAGCRFSYGRPEDGLCQPMTLCFRMGNVDPERVDMAQVQEAYREAVSRGDITIPREDVLVFLHVWDRVLHFNSTRLLRKNPLDAFSISEAEMEGRRQVEELARFMRQHASGFENAVLLMTAARMGVRESRRVLGDYVLTEADIVEVRKFPDAIARGTYPLDIHHPDGTGTRMCKLPPNEYYTIPYRACLPVDADNLLVAGRPISSTHEAHSAFRIMPICMCIGEAVGIAAATCAQTGCGIRDMDVGRLQETLRTHGALV